MLRVFFPYFYPADNLPLDWWDWFTPSPCDNRFHMFRWGKSVTVPDSPDDIVYFPIKRCRVDMPDAYDEYIDLHTAGIDPEPVKFEEAFQTAYGTIQRVLMVPSTLLENSLINQLVVESEVGEWGQEKTHSLSYPHPNTAYARTDIRNGTGNGRVWFVNETIEASPSLSVTEYAVFAAQFTNTGSGGYGGPVMEPCIVPCHAAATDSIRVEWDSGNLTIDANSKIKIYRAPAEASSTPLVCCPWTDMSYWRWLDQPLLVHTINSGATVASSTSLLLFKTATYPYPTKDVTLTVDKFAAFAFLNDAIARMGLAWDTRNRSTGNSFLVINADTLKYYKGYLLEVSPVFQEGPGKVDDRMARFSLLITEEGSCTPDALTGPNTVANFEAYSRTA